MINRIIIAYNYLEGSASANRILCFAKGYRDYGLEVHLMLLAPKEDKDYRLDGVDVQFYTEPKVPTKIARKLLGVPRFVRAIKRLYQPGNTAIHIYRTPWWGCFFNKKKYNYFFERGEIPFYVDSKALFYRFEEYIGLKLSPKATGLLAQTYALKNFYSQYGVTNIEVINMFVDVSRFENLLVDKSVKYVAYCGIISHHKDGVDVLISAFEHLHKIHQDYKLILIGGFDTICNDEECIRGKVDRLGLTDSVVFTGRVKANEIPQLLANASILAIARTENKQTKYGFPTKLGEYLCTGNPIVLTPVGEIGNYMKDRVNCLFAKPGDVEDFADKLNWVVENYEQACKIGKAGRLLIDSDFSISTQTKKAIDFMIKVSNPDI